jgi:DNA-binding response OmpR family regulator
MQMEIIIVDDEPVSLTVLKQFIEKLSDCRVRTFARASEALAWCKSNEPDLIVISYMMPQLNGIEFTRLLRTLEGKAETPILMVTANVDREIRNSGHQAGINDFLTKPFDFSELRVRVSNMLALRASQKELANRRALLLAEKVCGDAMDAVTGRRENGVPLLDINMTRARFGDDELLLGEVARVFSRTAPQLLTSISTALNKNDLKRVAEQAHSLKGAVAAFEAPDVFKCVVYVERHAKNLDVETTAIAFTVAQTLVDRLLTELAPIAPREAGRKTRA